MEELNNVIETIEVIEPVEILEEINNQEITGSYSKTVGIIALTAVVAAGIYGFKKFTDWRKSKNETEDMNVVFEEVIDETEIEDLEENI